MWQLGGLSTCDVVRRKTSALRAEMNPIGEFLEMRCVVDPDAETPARDLRDAYEEWAADFGAKAINNREWGERLKALGCHSHRERRGDSRIAVWQGIGLLDDALEEQDA
jgi:putative DNA primase/helicase